MVPVPPPFNEYTAVYASELAVLSWAAISSTNSWLPPALPPGATAPHPPIAVLSANAPAATAVLTLRRRWVLIPVGQRAPRWAAGVRRAAQLRVAGVGLAAPRRVAGVRRGALGCVGPRTLGGKANPRSTTPAQRRNTESGGTAGTALIWLPPPVARKPVVGFVMQCEGNSDRPCDRSCGGFRAGRRRAPAARYAHPRHRLQRGDHSPHARHAARAQAARHRHIDDRGGDDRAGAGRARRCAAHAETD